MSNKDTIIEALTMQLRLEREGNLALAKREWVGLTREDKDDLVHALPDFYSMEDVIKATESRLKEKNA